MQGHMNYSLRQFDVFGRCFLLSEMGKWEPFISTEKGEGKVPERAVAHLIVPLTCTNGTGTRPLTHKETLSLPPPFFFPARSMFSDDFPLHVPFPFTL